MTKPLERDAISFCPKTRATTSRRFAIVEVEHPTESLVPADHPDFLYRARHRPDQPIVQPLMISLPVVQVDTLIPISLNREKYGTHGILGTASGYASMRDL